MFGRVAPASVRVPYSAISRPGLRIVRETITAMKEAYKALIPMRRWGVPADLAGAVDGAGAPPG